MLKTRMKSEWLTSLINAKNIYVFIQTCHKNQIMANNTTELNISVEQAVQHGGITMISK